MSQLPEGQHNQNIPEINNNKLSSDFLIFSGVTNSLNEIQQLLVSS